MKSLVLGSMGALLMGVSAHAAIRVYNPETGSTEAAPTYNSDAPAPAILNKPKISPEPKRTVRPILLPEEEEAAEAAATTYPLGEVVFFVDFRQYTPDVGQLIEKLQKLEKLDVSAYMESKDPKEYARDILMMQRTGKIDAKLVADDMRDMPSLSSDDGGQAYGYHRPGGWHKVVYYDGKSSKRVYDLSYEQDKLQRHINRTARALKKGNP